VSFETFVFWMQMQPGWHTTSSVSKKLASHGFSCWIRETLLFWLLIPVWDGIWLLIQGMDKSDFLFGR
jgi:hypothetical protein